MILALHGCGSTREPPAFPLPTTATTTSWTNTSTTETQTTQADLSVSKASVTTSSSVPAIPYCRCEFQDSGTSPREQCETGLGHPCDSDSERKGACFEEGRLCEASYGCTAWPSFRDLNLMCNEAPTAEACLEQEACHYRQPSLTFRMACKSKGIYAHSPEANDRCQSLTDQGKGVCNNQYLCHWTIDVPEASPCKNNGIYRGCVGVDEALSKSCAIFDTNTSCDEEHSGLCQWQGSCECPSEFHGDQCAEERVQFKNHSGCIMDQSDIPTCKGLVIAAASSDAQSFCSDHQDCTIWKRVKRMVGHMRDVEIGQMLVDVIAACCMLAFVLIKYSYKHGKKKAEKKQDDTEKEDQKFLRTQYFLFACCVSFLVDLFLEGFLLFYLLNAAWVVTKLREAMCFTRNSDADDWLAGVTKSLHTSVWLVIIQMFVAVGGVGVELYQIQDEIKQTLEPDSDQFRDKACCSYSMLLLLVSIALHWVELFMTLANFIQSTAPFLGMIHRIELRALQEMAGHVCYVRHPSLPETSATGVGWPHPARDIVLPFLVVFLFFLLATFLTWYTSEHGVPQWSCARFRTSDWWHPKPPPPPPPAPAETLQIEVIVPPSVSAEIEVSPPRRLETLAAPADQADLPVTLVTAKAEVEAAVCSQGAQDQGTSPIPEPPNTMLVTFSCTPDAPDLNQIAPDSDGTELRQLACADHHRPTASCDSHMSHARTLLPAPRVRDPGEGLPAHHSCEVTAPRPSWRPGVFTSWAAPTAQQAPNTHVCQWPPAPAPVCRPWCWSPGVGSTAVTPAPVQSPHLGPRAPRLA